VQNDKPSIPPIVFVLAAVFIWSTGGLFIKLTSLDAFTVNLGRSLFAAITVAIFTYKKGLKLDRFTILTSFLYAGTLTCFVYANKNTTAANAIFLQYTAPIYILLLAPFVLKEKFRITDLVTVFFCLIGMSLFFVGQFDTAAFTGNIVALLSGLFFGLYFVFLRHDRSLANRNPALSVFYGNVLIVILMIPLVAPNLTTQLDSIGPKDILAILFLGVFQIGIAYLLFTKGIASGVRSLDASIIGFIEPLLNPVWVFLFLAEKPTNYAILGGTIIVATVAAHTLIQYRSQNRER